MIVSSQLTPLRPSSTHSRHILTVDELTWLFNRNNSRKLRITAICTEGREKIQANSRQFFPKTVLCHVLRISRPEILNRACLLKNCSLICHALSTLIKQVIQEIITSQSLQFYSKPVLCCWVRWSSAAMFRNRCRKPSKESVVYIRQFQCWSIPWLTIGGANVENSVVILGYPSVCWTMHCVIDIHDVKRSTLMFYAGRKIIRWNDYGTFNNIKTVLSWKMCLFQHNFYVCKVDLL